MSFPAYDEYKDSGVEWLGKVPAARDVVAIKRRFEIVGGSTPKSGEESLWEGDIRWATPSDLSRLDSLYLRDTQRTITDAGLESCGTTLVSTGSIILSTRAPIGSLAIADTEMCTNQGSKSLIPCEYADSKYFAYLLSISSDELNIRGKGTTFLELSADALGAFEVPAPSLDEQKAISSFLDVETSKIDALVSEQRRLIELLKEKRQAVISHAVTKGLNPNAPMKPSGIQCLGDVPEHWEIRKVSHLFRANKGKHGQMLTKEYLGQNEGDYPVYSGQTENNGVMGTWTEYEFDFGDDGVLFSTTVGAKAMHLFHLFGRFSLSQNCMIIAATDPQCDVRFFYYHFQPLFAYERAMIPEHMQASFRMDDLYTYLVAVPPTDEQQEIAKYLEDGTQRFDALQAEAERAIELLQERRTALISAAVTGKIDVRKFAPVSGKALAAGPSAQQGIQA